MDLSNLDFVTSVKYFWNSESYYLAALFIVYMSLYNINCIPKLDLYIVYL